MQTRAWAVVLGLAGVASAACPYAAVLAKEVIVADSNCGSQQWCVVRSSDCAMLNFTYKASYDMFTNFQALGNLANYPNPDLTIQNTSTIDLTKMVLPKTLENMYFENIKSITLSQITSPWPALTSLNFINCSLKSVPNTFTFPTGVKTLNWNSNAFMRLPSGIPSSVRVLAFGGNSLMTLAGLPPSPTLLNFYNNELTEVSNMDWSTVTFVRLGFNPLVTFAFVELSPQLAFFEIKDCPISNFTVTPQTYAALNALKKWDGDTDNYAGFVVTRSILTSSSACAAINGQIRSLWASSASYTISVCVASPGASSVDPSSAPAPVTKAPITKVPSPSSGSQASGKDKDPPSDANTGLIVGLIIGGLVIVVLVVLLIRRHQSDKTPPVTAEYHYAPPTTQAYVYQPMEAEPYQYQSPEPPLYVPPKQPAPAPAPSQYAPTCVASSRSSNYPIPTGGSGPFVPPRTSTGGSGGHVASSGSLPTATSIMSEGDIFLDVAPLRPHKLELADLTVISERPISSGAYGEVWLGQHGNEKVAIKKLKDQSPASVFQFIEEIKLLSRMNSDFIVKFVGASWRRPIEMECVVEYMDLGDLRNYLATNSPASFSWDQKLKSIVSIVRGLVYLHTFSPPIIHRDLKSRNVLLDSKKGTKLTDFGSSREIDESTLTNGVGTYQWMAPEIIIGTEYTVAADIYSFGVILSEFSTHNVPYSDLVNPGTGRPWNQQYIITKVTTGQLTPTLDATHTPVWVREMAAVCLQNDPASRPSSMQLASMLQRL